MIEHTVEQVYIEFTSIVHSVKINLKRTLIRTVDFNIHFIHYNLSPVIRPGPLTLVHWLCVVDMSTQDAYCSRV